MLKEIMKQVRAEKPLIHCITNYVTVNDCANILLACGASPIMADEPEEAGAITSICAGLVLNIGTLNSRTIPAMLAAGETAKRLGHVIVFDPVGAGASALRTETSRKILQEIRPDVVRCNISELKVLMNSTTSLSRGVDAAEMDHVTDGNLPEAAAMLRHFAKEYDCITAVSGAIDLLAAPSGEVCCVRNGHPMMAEITGSGCMLTCLTAAFAAAGKDNVFGAVRAAFCAMGLAGETAAGKMLPDEGNATFRTRLIDAFCHEENFRESQVRCAML